MKPPQNKWPTTDKAQLILFFAQICEEMFRYNAYESFRGQTLDLLEKLREFRRICKQALNGHVNEKTIVPVAQELRDSLLTDEIAGQLLLRRLSPFVEVLDNAEKSKIKDFDHYLNSADYVLAILETDYKRTLENEIIKFIDNQREKTKIYRLTKLYLPILINSGYSQEFVFREIQEKFFKSNIARADSRRIRSFFDKFDDQEKNYKVWIPLDKNTARFFESFGFKGVYSTKTIGELGSTAANTIRNSPRFSPSDKYILFKNEALDPFSAMRDADFLLRMLISTTVLDERGVSHRPKDYGYVCAEGSRTVENVHRRKFRIQPLSKGISKGRSERILNLASGVMTKFEGSSLARLLNALESVAIARATDNPENQLILVWSSIEVLFGNPRAGETRIAHYAKCLLACVTLNYLWRYSSAVLNQIQTHHRHLLDETINLMEEKSGEDVHRHFLSILLNPKNSNALHNLRQGLLKNPAARERIERLKDEYSNPENLRKINHRHEERIKWQLYRIYRARNDFIHAGYKPKFINQLALNSFEYFKTAVLSIIYRGEKNINKSLEFHISSILLDNVSRKSKIAGFAKMDSSIVGEEIAAFIQRT